jgi:sirohydrochlorin ferrochelatase
VILLLAHGSRDPRHRAGVEALAAEVAIAAPHDDVRHAFFDFHGPDLVTAVAAAELGVEVVVLPLLMSAGVHLQKDVPAAVAGAQLDRADLRWRLKPPLPAARLTGVVTRYLQAKTEVVRRGRGLVLVAAGSARVGALAGIDELATELRDSLAVRVRVANGVNEVTTAGEQATAAGESWLPVLYADGRLLDELRMRANDYGAEVLPPVGTLPGVAAALASWAATESIELEDSSGPPG